MDINTSENYEAASKALHYWANYIETGNPTLSAVDCAAANLGESLKKRPLETSQLELIVKIRKLAEEYNQRRIFHPKFEAEGSVTGTTRPTITPDPPKLEELTSESNWWQLIDDSNALVNLEDCCGIHKTERHEIGKSIVHLLVFECTSCNSFSYSYSSKESRDSDHPHFRRTLVTSED